MTPEYAAKGHKHVDSFITNLPQIYPDQRVLTVEMPTARKGYEMISGKLPFSVVPGNHDYDSNWSDSRYPEGKDGFPYGMLAYGGLKNWRSEEHTSELQSLMRISYAVFCLKKKINKQT